ncbi:tail fiber domain-containing protein [Citrobacter sp. Igbk 16]|uniref:tail fiber domain-containing protein n=1 Tax=Citrobacter sp. Igbk 16 TaxID=2963958 RepID=UPI0023043F8F|nr:tail fiber domain-containing protein [Citrobacter sp. Igbk 16]MDA8518966.1 tail fiber domain-containing protein [Citrobacter sp. Igbk 16]
MAKDIFSGSTVKLFYNTDTANRNIISGGNVEIENVATFPVFGVKNQTATIETYDSEYTRAMVGDKQIDDLEIVVNYRPDSVTHQFLDNAYDKNEAFQLIINYIQDDEAGSIEGVMVSGNINSRVISGSKDEVVQMTYTYTPRNILSMGTRDIPPVLRRGDYGVGSNGTLDYPQYSPQEAEGNAFVMIPAADSDNPAGTDLYGIELVSQPTGQTNTNLMITNSGDLRIYARNNSTPWSRVYTSGESDTLYLSKSNNLSDLNNIVTARSNLNILSIGENDTRYMMGSRNLSEIVDVGAARTKLGVQSIAQSDSKYLQAINNLSDIDDAATARANLGIQSAVDSDSKYLKVIDNLNDVADKAQARTNLGVQSTVESDSKYVPKTTTINDIALSGNITLSSTDIGSLSIINNLSDVPDKAQARANLGIQSTVDSDAKYLIKSNNLSDLTDLALARANLDVAKTGDVFLKVDNLSGIIDRPAAWLNVRPQGSTPLAGDPVNDYDAATKRWVENLVGAGVTGPTMNGVMNYGVGDFHLRDSRTYIQPYEVTSDGQLLSRALYPELWAYAQMLSPIPDADWLNNPQTRARYSTGDGSTTFRVPDRNGVQPNSIRGLFARGDYGTSGDNGRVFEASAPNITAGIATDLNGKVWFPWSSPSGAFRTAGDGQTFRPDSGYSTGGQKNVLQLDASLSSGVYGRYGNGDNILPRSFVGVWVIRASGGFVAANTSWSVNNADSSLPPVNTVVTGGKVQSKYKVGVTDNFSADFYAQAAIGNGITEARIEAHGTNSAVMRFNSDGNLGITGEILPRSVNGIGGAYNPVVRKLKDQQSTDGSKSNYLSLLENVDCKVTNYIFTRIETGIAEYSWNFTRSDGYNSWFSMRSDNTMHTPLGQVSIQGSDVRIKENFEPVQKGAWERISKIGICEYTYKSNTIPQRGYLAQQMGEIDPLYVFEGGQAADDSGNEFQILNVNDKAVTADLITVVQELQTKIEDQQEQITQLMAMVHAQSISITELKNK